MFLLFLKVSVFSERAVEGIEDASCDVQDCDWSLNLWVNDT